jgi:hypothetical protein
MAYETITVGDLVGRVSFALSNLSTPDTALTTEIKWALDAALNDFLNKYDHPAFRKEGSVSWVASTVDYDLPEDFYRMIEPSLKYDEDPKYTLAFVEMQEWDRVEGDRWTVVGVDYPRHYTILDRDSTSGLYQIRPLPTPEAARDLTFWYMSMPSPMASASDATVVDRRFPPTLNHLLVEKAITYFPQFVSRDRLDLANMNAMRAEQDLMRLSRPVVGNVHVQRQYGRSGRHPFDDISGLSGTDLPTS